MLFEYPSVLSRFCLKVLGQDHNDLKGHCNLRSHKQGQTEPESENDQNDHRDILGETYQIVYILLDINTVNVTNKATDILL